jgi:hypothetical protein
MRRHPILWSLIAAYLIVVGLWSAAATPVVLAGAGLGHLLTALPAPALLAVAGIAWLRHRPVKAVAS